MTTTPAPHPNSSASPSDAHPGVSSVRWTRGAPEAIRSLDTLVGPDYTDVVTASVSNGLDRTPEQWVRVMLKGVPRGLLSMVPVIQRLILGLRLELGPSRDHLLGWKIAERSERHMRLEAASWFLTGHIVVHVEDGRLSFATFLRYDRWPAALVWGPVSLIHRQVVLTLVRSAVRAS